LFTDSYFSKYSITWHRNHGLEGLALLLQSQHIYFHLAAKKGKQRGKLFTIECMVYSIKVFRGSSKRRL
jgi:hypothetical protein